jgi:uncharacterized protein with PIN domain
MVFVINTHHEPRFAVDENVIKLGRWLRMLGFDAAYYPISSDDELIKIASSEDRIILTRDHHFRERKARCFMVESTDPVEQVRDVIEAFKLRVSRKRFLSRCLECNVPIEEVENRSEIKDLVPPYVYKTQEEFCRCPVCGKVFWKGTHVENMSNKLELVVRRYANVFP